ncbi:phosphoribosylglycinamide formyltransferase [Zeaxanthinibacter enoshimensis]|uniref:Phosphoribosylglycinamide formyltransferase n=1 Tax=Zeaxanthinibacter enoshimensis TaxID=392009 RepID=A0A4R6TRZ4_9FLAO|nr:phosphoribosylglycinamide formyltransferase [Zeaxanthinibacter enoshimensis]TDQ32923.1 phosphoribosylglycinamide formyltransferase-1 [Zeaxanthinibacter enoshimensis]
MKRITLFASGSGSNVENIHEYFKGSKSVEIAGVLTNKKNAGVLDRCDRLGINAFYFNKHALYNTEAVVSLVNSLETDLVVLAGFLWKIPDSLLRAYPGKIINIHPALLPRYGGKGMYGIRVHQAVVDNKEPYTGITIHYVNENYDEGAIIVQEQIPVAAADTAEDVAAKVHELEYEHFPRVIEELLNKQLN